MKTIKFIGIILFTLLVVNSVQVKAQNPNVEGTRTVVWVLENGWGSIPVFCDGTQVDMLKGSGFKLLFREHYKEGVFTKMIISGSGKVVYTSENTGEKFTIHEVDRMEVEKGEYIWHFNAKGEDGTHYIGHMVTDPTTWKVVEAKVNCK